METTEDLVVKDMRAALVVYYTDQATMFQAFADDFALQGRTVQYLDADGVRLEYHTRGLSAREGATILAGCPVGGLVLDPFIGSGTVGAVAERLGRRWVGTDLSYQPLAQARTAQMGLRL